MDGFFPIELSWGIDVSFIGNLASYRLTDAAVLREGCSVDFVIYALISISAFD